MPILNCYVDDETMARLDRFSRETGRSLEELAESCISEGALNAERIEDRKERANERMSL